MAILRSFKGVQQDILAKYERIIDRIRSSDDEILVQQEYLRQHLALYKAHARHAAGAAAADDEMDSIFVVRDVVHKMVRYILTRADGLIDLQRVGTKSASHSRSQSQTKAPATHATAVHCVDQPGLQPLSLQPQPQPRHAQR